MSDLSSIFDILRGGQPDLSALQWDFIQDSGAASDIEEGTIVAVVAASDPTSVDRHQSALVGPDSDQRDHAWLVIRGRESAESEFTGVLTCLKMRTGIKYRVPTLLAPAIGDQVWADADGVLTNVDPGGGVHHLGKVLEYDATDGWIVVES